MRIALLTALLLTLVPSGAAAETIWISTPSTLIRVDSASPGTAIDSIDVVGLLGGDSLAGIDFRPATGQLYGLGSGGRLYRIDTTSGQATQVGSAFTLNGSRFGFDFNPTVDRIRVVSDSGQNLRLHPDTGAVAFTDTSLAFAAGDVNAGEAPQVAGAGYTNSIAGATTTTLYDIERGNNVLVTQAPPNNGTLNTVGSLGITLADGSVGFDIASRSGNAYLAADTGSGARLFSVSLLNGSTTPRGAIAGDPEITGLAVALSEGNCLPSTTALCLNGDRFRVTANWTTATGATGAGTAVDLTDDTGYFYFFTSTNVELVVKVLDACSSFNRFWVFAGGLTNVQVQLTVTDTDNNTVWTRTSPQNTPFQPIQDTNAFATCP